MTHRLGPLRLPVAAARPPRHRTPATYLEQMTPAVRASLDADQLAEVSRLLDLAIAKPTPKLVDLRFDIDLIVSRYFIVLFVGKDRRQTRRPHAVTPLTRIGNWVAAVTLLLSVNLAISATIILLAYLVKSALGIDLTPGHFRGFMQ